MSPKRSVWLHYYTEYLLASLLCLFILVHYIHSSLSTEYINRCPF